MKRGFKLVASSDEEERILQPWDEFVGILDKVSRSEDGLKLSVSLRLQRVALALNIPMEMMPLTIPKIGTKILLLRTDEGYKIRRYYR